MMKKVILTIVCVCLFACPAYATHYEITSYYYGALGLENYDTLLVTSDGGLSVLDMFDFSSAVIQNTSPLEEALGGIWQIHVAADAHLEISGGEIHEIFMNNDNATARLSGGLIENIYNYQEAQKWDDALGWVPNPHITIVYSGDLPMVDASNVLSGLWGNGNPFSIQLNDVSGFDPVIENIQFELIPEPVTLVLLGFGGLLIRRKK